MTDQEIVQQYANEGQLNELPPRAYILTETIHIPSVA